MAKYKWPKQHVEQDDFVILNHITYLNLLKSKKSGTIKQNTNCFT